MAVQLKINVREPDTVLASFNAIRVKRSITGEAGVYSLLTALAPAAAILQATEDELYDVSGKTLSILRDSHAQVDVHFTGTGLLTATQVATQINAALGVSIASVVTNELRLTSTITGTASKIEIASSSAASAFGWSAGSRAIGYDTHITIQSGQTLYEYTDNDGDEDYFYKVSYLNTSNGQISADSDPFAGESATLISTSNLSLIRVDLVDGQGVAAPAQPITFYPMHELLEVEGYQVALTRDPICISTDNLGHAEVHLVRGSRWRVAFEGTSIIRDITIPDAAETDLMTVLAQARDPFDVQTLLINPAIRRTV